MTRAAWFGVVLGWALVGCSGSVSGAPNGAGGSAAGGSAAGGSNAGGSNAGGSNAGGSDAGGSDAGATDGVLDVGVISQGPGAQSESSVAVTPDGRVAVAWMNIDATRGIGYAVSQNGGAKFPTPVSILPGASRNADDPSLTVDAHGALWLTWLEAQCTSATSCSNGHVFVATAPPGSSSFGAPVDVTDADPSAFYDKPWIAKTGDGALLVSYARIVGTTRSIVVSRSLDGQHWTRSTVVSPPSGGMVGVPHLCTDPSGPRVWIVYSDGASPTFTSIRWSDDDGMSWPAANVGQVGLTQESNQVQSYDAKCVGQGNDVWVLYSLSNQMATTAQLGVFNAVRLEHSGNRGKTFDPPVSVNDAAAASYELRPEIAREAGGAFDIGYYAGDAQGDAHGSFRWAREPAGSSSFGASEAVHTPLLFTGDRSSFDWIGDYSGFAVAGGYLYVSYADNSSGITHVAFWRSARLSP